MNCSATGFYGAVYWHYVTTYLRLPRRLNVHDRCRSLSPKSCLWCLGHMAVKIAIPPGIVFAYARSRSSYHMRFETSACHGRNLQSSPEDWTCEEPMLMELYELVCKAEDNLRVKLDKIKKRKADEEENDEQVTRRPEEFFFKQIMSKISLLLWNVQVKQRGALREEQLTK
ncbi:hypothetical protein Tco_0831153, partial [Tanacetum coccineum]